MAWRRVGYSWARDRSPESWADDLEWRPFDEAGDLVLVGAALANSPNAWDTAAVAVHGSSGAAARLVAAVPPHRPHRWEVVLRDGAEAGFVLPVVFATGGQGTVWHVGVLPEHRGHGIGRALLRRATAGLVEAGVTAVKCDADIANAPMIHLFDSDGWERGEEYERELTV